MSQALPDTIATTNRPEGTAGSLAVRTGPVASKSMKEKGPAGLAPPSLN